MTEDDWTTGRRFATWAIGLLAVLGVALTTDAQGATLATDKPDYSPGETVIITGSGWQPGETVSLFLEESPLIDPSLELFAVADANGDIQNSDYVVEADDAGVTFTLTATGLSSTQVAQTVFTDSPVVFDAASSDDTGGSTMTSLTVSHTVSGTNRLLIVGVSIRNDSGQTVTGIIYDSVALTLVGAISNGSVVRAEIWRLVAPNTGTHDIVVTVSAAAKFAVGAVSFTNVDQTTPLGSFFSATGTGTTASVSVTGVNTDELVIDTLALAGTGTPTAGAGQTERWSTATSGASSVRGAGSTELSTGTVTMSWTFTSADWAIGAAAIKPAPAVATTTTTSSTTSTSTTTSSTTSTLFCPASGTCTVDMQGADDEPGQKDLNEFCPDGACTGGSIIAWTFDDTRWTGANTGDACALYDGDGDGNANNAVCVTVTNGSADGTTAPSITSTTCYSCDDDRPDRCTNSMTVTCTSTCSFAYACDPFASDAMHTSADCAGPTALHLCEDEDSLITCCVKPSEFGGTAVLTDVCSYPSSVPNSDPSDCIINPPSCTTDADCDDSKPCSVDTCVSNDCQHASAPSSTVCRAAAGACDLAENCTGSSPDCPADAKAPSGTVCRAAGGSCDVAEVCDGTSDDCPADTVSPSSTVCRPSAGVCDVAENCTGSSGTCPTDAFEPSSTVCRASAGVCDVAENCTGSSADCPAAGFESSSTVCRASAGVCDVAENCTGSSADCPTDGFESSSTVCRASAGVCDVAENCDGINDACPPDMFESSATVCRPSAGVCDLTENCTGSSADCPADAKSGTVCRPSAGVCDVDESCDGMNDACPPDAFESSATVCRASAGVCDLTENCTGSGADCPADAKSSAVCRASAGVCDVTESCDGTNDDCPADSVEPAFVVCRASAGECDPAENCDGTNVDCPPDAKNDTVCRPSAGVCDMAESCDGAADMCPPDAFAPSSMVCRPSAGVCDMAESCTGSSADCPADGFQPSSTVCRSSAGVCDMAENCTGGSADCPADAKKPSGTICRPAVDACDVVEYCDGVSDNCGADVMCTTTTSTSSTTTTSSTTSTIPVFAGCGSLTKDPCSVAVTKGSKPPKYFSDLQQAVNAAANGSTLTVSGLCEGPVFIVKRSSLTIQGIKPVTTGSGCPAGGLSPSDLSSTVTSAMDEVIKVVQSSNIKIQFLNVVDGPGDGIEFKDSSKGTAFCNCIARNDEGIVLHGAASTTMSENLVTDHLRDGILLHPGLKPSKKNTVSRNLVRGNGLNGIQLREDALQNLVTENDVIGNADDGVELSMESDKNRVLSNSVTLNGNRGVVIEDSDKNEVHGNTIAANGDAEVNQAKCVSGKKNKGNNVPPPCQ